MSYAAQCRKAAASRDSASSLPRIANVASMGGETVQIQRPAPNQLPHAQADFRPLFRCLDHNNILAVFVGVFWFAMSCVI